MTFEAVTRSFPSCIIFVYRNVSFVTPEDDNPSVNRAPNCVNVAWKIPDVSFTCVYDHNWESVGDCDTRHYVFTQFLPNSMDTSSWEGSIPFCYAPDCPEGKFCPDPNEQLDCGDPMCALALEYFRDGFIVMHEAIQVLRS